MSRLPIKLRVTLAFAGVMAVVLAALGLFLLTELRDRLDESINNGLRSRAGEVAALVQSSDTGLRRSREAALIEADEGFAQVLTPGGEVVDASPQVGGQPVLDAGELIRASQDARFLESDSVPGVDGTVRLLAAPTSVGENGDQRVIVVVGASLDDRDEAVASLTTLLAIGGPAALLLASLAGYGALALALRPVEAMRREAAEISAGEPEERLPVPAGDDELSRLGETLNQMLARLEATLARERRFVDDASHELRTPLALHKTELELALRYGSDTRELRAAISSAIDEIDRLIQLAEDMLVVARSGEGGLELAQEPLPANELLETVAQRFRSRAAQADRSLSVDGEGLVVRGDRIRLEQALTSLVDNAFRHGDGEVRMWASNSGDGVQLHVTDSGPGFPPDFIAQAFERFTRADEARGRGGTGLGLAIVQTIAVAHGGRAAAANDPAGGADVWITVPAARQQDTGLSSSFHPGSVEIAADNDTSTQEA
jgi:signal transduction histidine kinase